MMKKSFFVISLFVTLTAKATCFVQAGERYHVSPVLLEAIAQQESSMNPNAYNVNTNGTYDMGLMGINSTHLPALARYGLTASHLMDPCINVMIGAWLLSTHIARDGLSWGAVGAYHSRTPSKKSDYSNRIFRRVVTIQNQRGG